MTIIETSSSDKTQEIDMQPKQESDNNVVEFSALYSSVHLAPVDDKGNTWITVKDRLDNKETTAYIPFKVLCAYVSHQKIKVKSD